MNLPAIRFGYSPNTLVIRSAWDYDEARRLKDTIKQKLQEQTDVFVHTTRRANQQEHIILTGQAARDVKTSLLLHQTAEEILSHPEQYGLEDMTLDTLTREKLFRRASHDPEVNYDLMDRLDAYRQSATVLRVSPKPRSHLVQRPYMPMYNI